MPKSSTLTTAYSYDSVGNLLTQASSGASDIAFSYSYNKNGYITGEVRTENGQTTESSYAYDALGQLTSFLQSTGYGEQYAYDKAGNMTDTVSLLKPRLMCYNMSGDENEEIRDNH